MLVSNRITPRISTRSSLGTQPTENGRKRLLMHARKITHGRPRTKESHTFHFSLPTAPSRLPVGKKGGKISATLHNSINEEHVGKNKYKAYRLTISGPIGVRDGVASSLL